MNYNIYITTAEMIQKRGSNNSLFNKLYALNLPGLCRIVRELFHIMNYVPHSSFYAKKVNKIK